MSDKTIVRNSLQAGLAVSARCKSPRSGVTACAERIVTLSHTRKRSALAIALQFFAAIVAGFVSNTQEVVADNLFVSLGNNIEELTPNGTSTTFASGVAAVGLAFNTNGDLFSTEDPGGSIFQFAPKRDSIHLRRRRVLSAI